MLLTVVPLSVFFLLLMHSWESVTLCIIPHIILLFAFCLFERSRHQTGITPGTVFAVTYAVVVVIPALLESWAGELSRLTPASIIEGARVYLVFFVVAVCAYIVNCPVRKTALPKSDCQAQEKVLYRFFFACAVCSWFVYIAMLLLVARVNVLAYVKDPRSLFAVVRGGDFGWAYIARTTFYYVFVAMWALRVGNGSLKRQWVWGGLFIAGYSVTSGGKVNLFFPVICIIVVKGYVYQNLSRRSLALALLALVVGIPAAFAWRDRVAAEDLGTALREYNQQFRFTARTVTEVEPDSTYLWRAASGFALTPIPRVLWPNKPNNYGLTRTVLSEHFYGYSVAQSVRSFPTMGLSESWLALGRWGAVVSGAIVGLVLSVGCRQSLHARSVAGRVCGVVVSVSSYALLRVSIFDTYVYQLLCVWIVCSGANMWIGRRVVTRRVVGV